MCLISSEVTRSRAAENTLPKMFSRNLRGDFKKPSEMMSHLAEFFWVCMPCWGPSQPEERSAHPGQPHRTALTKKKQNHILL